MEAAAPATIAGYRLEETLGRGGMGIVYRAWDERLQRRVALKLVAAELAGDALFRERFFREARAAAAVEHPHVVPIYEVGEAGGIVFLAMRLIEGTDLDGLTAAGPLPVTRAVALIAQVAQALAAVHARGLVHRDVTGRNVLVAVQDGVEHAYLSDFGLARDADRGGTLDDGRWMGTLDYAAPERLRGASGDARADIYGLGCLLFRALAGRPPFAGAVPAAKLAAHLTEPPPRLPAPLRVQHPHLDALIRRSLAKDPAHRQPDAQAFLAELGDPQGPAGVPVPQRPRPPSDGATNAETEQVLQFVREDEPPGPTQPPLDLPAARLAEASTSFVGREQELAEIGRLLATARVMTLTGVGGSGKTRLAARAGAAAVPLHPRGVAWIELAPLREAPSVLPAVAAGLEVREEPGVTLLEAVVDRLAGGPALLVLDNCEHLLEPVAELVDRLLAAAPQLRILATSRQRLGVEGELVWQVPPLEVPPPAAPVDVIQWYPSVRLVVERAAEANPRFALNEANAEAVATICQRLEGLPLALELAAARLRLLTPGQVAQRLEDRLTLLSGRRKGGLPRHETLDAMVAWSYELLSDDEKALFRRLSVFAGAFTVEAAEEACAFEPLARAGIVDCVDALVEKSLLVAQPHDDEPRFGMLETLRAYAGARLYDHPREQEATRQRQLQWALDVVGRTAALIPEGDALARSQIERDHPNLVHALETALATGRVQEAMRLAVGLRPFWGLQGQFAQARQRLQACLEAGAGCPPADRARCLAATGYVALLQGDAADAESLMLQAIEYAREAGDLATAASTLRVLGHLSWETQRLELAFAQVEESVAIYRRIDDPEGLATSLSELAAVAIQEGDRSKAREWLEEALAIHHRLGRGRSVVADLLRLGVLAWWEGDLQSARCMYDEVIAESRRLDDRRSEGCALIRLAEVVTEEGDLAEARRRLEEAVTIMRDLHARPQLNWALARLALVARAQGHDDEARSLLEESVLVAAARDDLIGRSLLGLAELHAFEGDHVRAARLLGAAEARARVSWLSPRIPWASQAAAALGDEVFESHRQHGRRLSLDQAVRLGLGAPAGARERIASALAQGARSAAS